VPRLTVILNQLVQMALPATTATTAEAGGAEEKEKEEEKEDAGGSEVLAHLCFVAGHVAMKLLVALEEAELGLKKAQVSEGRGVKRRGGGGVGQLCHVVMFFT